MASSIHAHEIMHMMIDSGEQFTRETLKQKITEKFGADALFDACSEKEMTVERVVVFLEEKEKFVPAGEGFTTDASKICNH